MIYFKNNIFQDIYFFSIIMLKMNILCRKKEATYWKETLENNILKNQVQF